MNYWPESSHKPLLRATFLSGPESLQAWEQWLRLVDFDDYPDSGSYRLLPQLFKNLRAQGVQHPLMMRLRGIVRKNWTHNKHTLDAKHWPWVDFLAMGLDFILLPGAATALKTYAEYVLIPPKETAVLIHTKDYSNAIRCLKNNNWEPENENNDWKNLSPRQYNMRWLDNDGRSLRLYWHPYLAACRKEAVHPLFERAEPIQVQDLNINTLRIEDHILWTAGLHMDGQLEPQFIRAVETMLIIQSAAEINWPQISAQAHLSGLRQPLIELLQYLQETLDFQLPPGYLQELKESADLQNEIRLLSYNQPQTGGWRKAVGLWLLHRRCSGSDSWLAQILTFPRFLQQIWRLKSLWQVPLHPAAVLLRRLSRSFHKRQTEPPL